MRSVRSHPCPPGGTPGRRLTTLVLLNPAAGGGRARGIAPNVLAAARQLWGEVEQVETQAAGEAVRLAEDASRAGVARIIVVGGDGTVHEAANGILKLPFDHRPPLGVIPIGTGNDFAKLIGTSGKSPRKALELLAHGRRRMFDVGLAWNEYFVNSLGLGFDAAVASRVPRYRGLWRPLVYPAAVASSYFKFRPLKARVRSDSEEFGTDIFCIEVGIGISAGGGFLLTPDAKPDDGLFDVCIVRPLSHWGFVTRMPAARWGRHLRFKEVTMLRSRRLTVTTGMPLQAHFDGEIRENSSGVILIELIPGALPVLIALE